MIESAAGDTYRYMIWCSAAARACKEAMSHGWFEFAANALTVRIRRDVGSVYDWRGKQ